MVEVKTNTVDNCQDKKGDERLDDVYFNDRYFWSQFGRW